MVEHRPVGEVLALAELASRSPDHAGRGRDPAPPALNGRAAKASFAIRIKTV
jgi:hypothetical protein